MNTNRSSERFYVDVPLLPMKRVSEITSLSRATIYRRISAGTFPKPVNLGGRRIAFARNELDRWIANPLAYHQDLNS